MTAHLPLVARFRYAGLYVSRMKLTCAVRAKDAETLIAAIHEEWGEAQGNYD
jgi:hypothetical protein